MPIEAQNRADIVGSMGLLGASLGIILGLAEAACLRLTDLPLVFMRPHVRPSFWFFAPLLGGVIFGLLGLLAGFFTRFLRVRLLVMATIAGLAGLSGAYLGVVLSYTQLVTGWYVALKQFFTPTVLFAVVFSWTLSALWATRKPGSPLGFLAEAPKRAWSRTVVGSLAALAAAAGISSLPGHWAAATTSAASRHPSPNIVLIVWDTTRADHLSSYGYHRNTTPNIDQLARRGVLFENAFSASSWTLPSMASVFTSLLPHQHGAGPDWGLGNGPRTLAEILHVGGYETAGFNANSYYGLAAWGLGRGFETYIDSTGTLGYGLDATRLGHELVEPASEELLHHSRINQFTAHQLNEEIYRWYKHRSDRPYFLFLNYNDAHEPYEAPPPYDRLYGQMSANSKFLLHASQLGRIYLPPREREGAIAAYDQCLRYIDSQAGELLRFLARSPEWSNTYVIFASDHGEAFGDHDSYGHGWNLYHEVLRVPLIVAGPGIPAGVRVNHIARTRQIFSTTLEFAGVKSAVLRRTSLAQFWRPGYVPISPDEPTASELLDNGRLPAPWGLISLTTRNWHLIWRAGRERDLLYHWTTDLAEQRNVAFLPENEAVMEQLKASLTSIIERSYRPWRDARYLLAMSGPEFSPDLEAQKLLPPSPGGPLLVHGAGAAQALFPQNPETPSAAKNYPDDELLRSLPYDNAP